MIYISQLFDREDLKRIISEGDTGIELIDFSISENLDNLPSCIERTKELLDDLKPAAISVHGPFLDLNPMSFDSLVLEATEKRFEQAYEAALRIGADAVIYHSGMIPGIHYIEGWAEREADFFIKFMNGKNGITVCVENLLDREIEPLKKLVEYVNHPDFGICLDIGHAHCYSSHTAPDWADRLGPLIRHLHIHDNPGDADSHLALGRGNLPWAETLRIVKEKNPEAGITIENNTYEDALLSMELIKKVW